MNASIMIYIASFVLIGWGVAHLFPTGAVVRDFGEISHDNKNVITMEWITEGVALIFIGFLVGITTCLDMPSSFSKVIYWSAVAVLNILSAVSLFTGFKNSFIVYKLCPLIFTGSSILIVLGIWLR